MISVIIPIFNSEEYLPSLFLALEKCEFEKEDEVLLIDNGSTDNSLNLCKEKEKENPNLYKCLTYVEKASSYAARNYGVKESRGDVLVFTDSDCKPEAGWLTAIRNNIKEGVVIAGKISLEVTEKKVWQLFDSIAHLQSEANSKRQNVATANMAVLKKDFYRVGVFENRFSGGDYDWSRRAAANKLKIVYVEDAFVYHPTRKNFQEILKKEQRIAFGSGNHYKLQKKKLFFLVGKYFLKCFKIDTNIRYSKALYQMGIKGGEIIKFNIGFIKIRMEQLKYVIKGYNNEDVRQLGIK